MIVNWNEMHGLYYEFQPTSSAYLCHYTTSNQNSPLIFLWSVSEIINIKLTPDNFDHVVLENQKSK
jgi:hypothetical protein